MPFSRGLKVFADLGDPLYRALELGHRSLESVPNQSHPSLQKPLTFCPFALLFGEVGYVSVRENNM